MHMIILRQEIERGNSADVSQTKKYIRKKKRGKHIITKTERVQYNSQHI